MDDGLVCPRIFHIYQNGTAGRSTSSITLYPHSGSRNRYERGALVVAGGLCRPVELRVGGVLGVAELGGTFFASFRRSPIALAVPISIRRKFSSVTSSARKICGVMTKTISLSRRCLSSWPKRYFKMGIFASHG